ncbi:MAG: cyclic-di-AMP receptor [Acutalibacteraceae bacterium]
MKLITAVIGKKDMNPVCDALREAGFSFTKIPTSGGFLRSSNMTLLLGVDDDKLSAAVELIDKNCRKHTEQTDEKKVTVGGATVFVTDVERFEKM